MAPLTPVWDVLVYVVVPLWLLSGFVDYLCHRFTAIEKANGASESVLHWLMLSEVAVPILLVLSFKVTGLILVLMLPALVIHEVTAWYDLRIANRTRNVTPFEQQVHSFLEMMPFMAMLLMYILHWPQVMALVGMGPDKVDWRLIWQPMPWYSIVTVLAAVFLLGVLPYVEEFLRGLAAVRKGKVRPAYKIEPELR